MISYSSRQQINRSNSGIQIQRIQQFDPFATSLTSKLRLALLNVKSKLHWICEWEILDKDLRYRKEIDHYEAMLFKIVYIKHFTVNAIASDDGCSSRAFFTGCFRF